MVEFFEKSKANKWRSAVLAALLSALLFMCLCFVLRITPFGDRTFLYEDMKQQYVDFFAYYRNVWHGKDGFFYSDNCGLGDNMLGIWAYYLTSPFLLMFAVIPKEYFAVAVTFLIMLKVSAVAGTTSLFLSYISDWLLKPADKDKNVYLTIESGADLNHSGKQVGFERVANIFVSVAFSYSGWMIANMTNIMWLDAVIMMPLVLIAFFMMQRGQKHGRILYILSVMVMVVMNYYIAAMILMFLGVFAILMVSDACGGIRKFIEFVLSTMCGLALDGWFLVPTVMSLMGSNKDHSAQMSWALTEYLPSSEAIAKYISPFSVISKLFTMSYDSLEIMEGMPNIYFGAALIIPCILFFFNKKISSKLKWLLGIFLAVIMMFFCIKPLNTLAHGGTEAYGYLYRYSFIFSFVCVVMAYLCLTEIDGIDFRQALVGGGITAGLLVLAYSSKPGFMGRKAWLLNVAVLFAIEAFCVIYVRLMRGNSNSRKNILPMLMAAMGIVFAIDISLNFICIYRNSSMNAETASGYLEKYEKTKEVLERIADSDGIYRIESVSNRTPNDSLYYGYRGTTTYNSLLKVENRLFMYKLGFNDNGLYTTYDVDNTKCADAVLGIRYIVGDDGQSITRNDTALPAELTASDKIPELLKLVKNADNPFDAQQILWNEFTGSREAVFEEAECEEFFADNVNSESDEDHEGISENAEGGKGDNQSLSENADKGIVARYIIRPVRDGELYFYMNKDKNKERSLAVFVNDVLISNYGNASCQKVLDLGNYKAGERVELAIEDYDGNGEMPGEPIVVTENVDALK